jgi:hypothetical protein
MIKSEKSPGWGAWEGCTEDEWRRSGLSWEGYKRAQAKAQEVGDAIVKGSLPWNGPHRSVWTRIETIWWAAYTTRLGDLNRRLSGRHARPGQTAEMIEVAAGFFEARAEKADDETALLVDLQGWMDRNDI